VPDVKLLLTSGGVSNESIKNALVDLLGKPIAESSALCIPTAVHPMGNGTAMAGRVIRGEASTPMTELGWRSVGVLELTALPSIDREPWVNAVMETDALLVSGGDPMYLTYWLRESGLADLLPSLPDDLVWVGVSAGSMVLAPRVGEDFLNWTPPGGGGDTTLGIVDFAMCPHMDNPKLPDNSMAEVEKWAARMPIPAYGMDDDTAIRVVDGTIDVITEGNWRLFP
jgi:dipeptidase E